VYKLLSSSEAKRILIDFGSAIHLGQYFVNTFNSLVTEEPILFDHIRHQHHRFSLKMEMLSLKD
jgi:hypothetical protein